jgi:hypothetical protein
LVLRPKILALALALPPQALALAMTLLALLTHEQGHICILCHKNDNCVLLKRCHPSVLHLQLVSRLMSA